MSEVHVEQLVGRRVVDVDGRPIGRVEEVRAERDNGEWIVREYVLGANGLLERLAAERLVASFFGPWARRRDRHTVPWDALDLSDPERPRLTRPLAAARRRVA